MANRKFGWHSGVGKARGMKLGPVGDRVISEKIWVPANQLSLETSGTAATAGQVDNAYRLLFDAASDEDANYAFLLPSWPGKNLKVRAKLYWSSAATSGNDVVWDIDYGAFKVGEDIDLSSPTNVTTTSADSTTANVMNVTNELVMDASAGELLVMHLYRDANEGADDLASDAALLGMSLEITEA